MRSNGPRTFGLIGALLLASGCAELPSTTGGDARAMPAAEITQLVPGAQAAGAALHVVKRSFGGGYAMFELNRAIDAALFERSAARLMTVRPAAAGGLQVIEAAGDSFVDASGKVVAIALADSPEPGEVYRAQAVIAGQTLDLGDLIVKEPPASGADLANAMYVAPRYLGRGIDPLPIGTAAPTLTLVSTTPENSTVDVARDLIQVTVKYGGTSPIDCAHAIQGRAGFHLYSVDPALPASRQQDLYPDMPVGYPVPIPELNCDTARNEISMSLPGPLLGGSVFKM